MRYWIGIAARDHVLRGVAEGFCQLGHGKMAPVRRLSVGDWITYYSPRTALTDGKPVQAFTALGRITSEMYEATQAPGFHPYRRDVDWRTDAQEASIRPLLDQLDLTRGRKDWGLLFRRPSIELTAADFRLIASAMGQPDLAD